MVLLLLLLRLLPSALFLIWAYIHEDAPGTLRHVLLTVHAHRPLPPASPLLRPTPTAPQVPLSQRPRLALLEHRLQRHQRGEAPAVDWLDALTLAVGGLCMHGALRLGLQCCLYMYQSKTRAVACMHVS